MAGAVAERTVGAFEEAYPGFVAMNTLGMNMAVVADSDHNVRNVGRGLSGSAHKDLAPGDGVMAALLSDIFLHEETAGRDDTYLDLANMAVEDLYELRRLIALAEPYLQYALKDGPTKAFAAGTFSEGSLKVHRDPVSRINKVNLDMGLTSSVVSVSRCIPTFVVPDFRRQRIIELTRASNTLSYLGAFAARDNRNRPLGKLFGFDTAPSRTDMPSIVTGVGRLETFIRAEQSPDNKFAAALALRQAGVEVIPAFLPKEYKNAATNQLVDSIVNSLGGAPKAEGPNLTAAQVAVVAGVLKVSHSRLRKMLDDRAQEITGSRDTTGLDYGNACRAMELFSGFVELVSKVESQTD